MRMVVNQAEIMRDESAKVEKQDEVTIRLILADRAVRTVVLVAFVMLMGIGVIGPTLALYGRSFGVGYAAVGLMLSAFGLSRLACDLFAGPLVDRFGERRCAPAGLLHLAICALLTGLAPNFATAAIFWGIGGAGSAVAFAAQFSYLLKVVPKDRMARTLGVFYTAFNAGIIGGGAAGGLIADRFGLASPLFVFSVLMVVAGAIYLRWVPDPVRATQEPPLSTEEVLLEREMPLLRRTKSRMADLLKIPGFVTVLALNFAYVWVIAAVYDTLVPLFGNEELGMSEALIGTVFAVAVATEFFVLYPAGRAADRLGRKPVLVPSFAALAALVATLGLSPSPLAFGALMGVVGIAAGYAGVPPAAMLSDLVPDDSSGTAVGLFRFAGDVGWFLGPMLAGLSTNAFGFGGAFAIAAVPVAIAFALLVRTPESLRSAPDSTTERKTTPQG
jgi:MFS family permease